MKTFKNILLKFLLLHVIWSGFSKVFAEPQSKICITGCYNRMKFGAIGRYNAKVHGFSGSYSPDISGMYVHVKVPYVGGYGDRGEIPYKINSNALNVTSEINELSIENNSFSYGDAENNFNGHQIENPISISSTWSNELAHGEALKKNISHSDLSLNKSNVVTGTANETKSSFESIDSKRYPTGVDSIRSPYAAETFKEIESGQSQLLYSENHINDSYAPKFQHFLNNELEVLRFDENGAENITYHYIYEADNKIVAEETGYLEDYGKKNLIMRVKGFYNYASGNGQNFKINYDADQYGFYPQGNHLHKTIKQALEYLRKRQKKEG